MEYKDKSGGMRLTPEQIVKRQDVAQKKKDEFQALYMDAYEFALPQRQLYGVWEGGYTGKNKMTRVFDSTAINSTQRFANRLQSVVFPPQRKWCRLDAGSDIPMDRKQTAQAVLEVYGDKMFTVLRQSNFDIAMGEFLLDLAVGTACMMVQPGDDVSCWYSTKCKLTWKLKGTKYSRMYCQLQVSTHRTSDLEFGLLLTPTTREEVQDLDKFKKRMEKYPNGTTMPNLATQINSMMLPTPAAVDYKQTTLCESQRERSTLPGMMVKMFKTPKASDKNMHWKTEKWKGDDLGSQINEMLGTRSHLSPLFVMEMMGFPTDWTLLPFLSGEQKV